MMTSPSMSLRASSHHIVSVAPILPVVPALSSFSSSTGATKIPQARSQSKRKFRSTHLRRADCQASTILPSWRKEHSLPSLRLRGVAGPRKGAQKRGQTLVRAVGGQDQSTFLSLEEAGLVEMTNLDMHERFLARLTVSSLNLLRVISKQEGIPIEELNAGKICDWFVKDKEKRSRNIEEATLKWNSQDW